MSVKKSSQRGLGRGLDALIPTDDFSSESKTQGERLASIPTGMIKPNPMQPRQNFKDESLSELSESIREHGIIQPLIVTKIDGGYELVAGERRLRAAKVVGLEEVPAVIRDAHEMKKLELAIIENVQRDSLNVLDEARGYQRLMQDFSLSQDDVAKKVGKSRSAVANKVRILSLPVEVKRALNAGQISEGHGRALLALNDPEKILMIFGLIMARKLSVRETEKKINEVMTGKTLNIQKDDVDPNIIHLENELKDIIGTRVQIKSKKKGGSLIIDYSSSEDMERILHFFLKKK